MNDQFNETAAQQFDQAVQRMSASEAARRVGMQIAGDACLRAYRLHYTQEVGNPPTVGMEEIHTAGVEGAREMIKLATAAYVKRYGRDPAWTETPDSFWKSIGQQVAQDHLLPMVMPRIHAAIEAGNRKQAERDRMHMAQIDPRLLAASLGVDDPTPGLPADQVLKQIEAREGGAE